MKRQQKFYKKRKIMMRSRLLKKSRIGVRSRIIRALKKLRVLSQSHRAQMTILIYSIEKTIMSKVRATFCA